MTSDGTAGAIAKFDPDGNLLWYEELSFGVWGNIAVDSTDNIYVVLSDESGGIILAKFRPDGELIRAVTLNVTDVYYSLITVGSDGYVYATGYSDSFGTFVAKLDPNRGSLIWFKTLPSSILTHFIIVAPDRGIYITGIYITGEEYIIESEYSDAFVAKLDSDGRLVWFRVIGWPNSYDEGDFIALSSDGCLVVVSAYSSENDDFIVWGYMQEVDLSQIDVQDRTSDISVAPYEGQIIIGGGNLTVDDVVVSIEPIDSTELTLDPIYGAGFFVEMCQTNQQPQSGLGKSLGGVAEPFSYWATVALIVATTLVIVTIMTRKQNS